MELVDLVDSKSSAFGRVGSNPTCGTTLFLNAILQKLNQLKHYHLCLELILRNETPLVLFSVTRTTLIFTSPQHIE